MKKEELIDRLRSIHNETNVDKTKNSIMDLIIDIAKTGIETENTTINYRQRIIEEPNWVTAPEPTCVNYSDNPEGLIFKDCGSIIHPH